MGNSKRSTSSCHFQSANDNVWAKVSRGWSCSCFWAICVNSLRYFYVGVEDCMGFSFPKFLARNRVSIKESAPLRLRHRMCVVLSRGSLLIEFALLSCYVYMQLFFKIKRTHNKAFEKSIFRIGYGYSQKNQAIFESPTPCFSMTIKSFVSLRLLLAFCLMGILSTECDLPINCAY